MAEPLQVAPVDEMPADIFCKHFSARHQDSLAGLTELRPELLTEGVEDAYRAFHRRLHETDAGSLGHYHRER